MCARPLIPRIGHDWPDPEGVATSSGAQTSGPSRRDSRCRWTRTDPGSRNAAGAGL